MICDNCNKKIKDSSVFCRYCGKKHNPSIIDDLESKFNDMGVNTGDSFISLGDLLQKPDWHFYLAQANEVAQNGEIFEAFEYCNKAMELQPNEPIIYHRRGLLYFQMEKNREAINDYNMALKINPNYYPSLICRGIIKDELGLFHEAIEDYDKALLIEPQNINALNNMAGAKLAIGDFESAKSFSTDVLRINSENKTSLYILGKALLKLGETQEAVKYLKKSAQLGFPLAIDELRNTTNK